MLSPGERQFWTFCLYMCVSMHAARSRLDVCHVLVHVSVIQTALIANNLYIYCTQDHEIALMVRTRRT